MQEVLTHIFDTRDMCEKENIRLAGKYGLGSGDQPIAALNMMHLYCTWSLELLSFYRDTWLRLPPAPAAEAELIRNENGERVMTTTKAALILSVSAVEFAAKRATELHPSALSLPSGRIYLRGIMKASHSASLITEVVYNGWNDVVELRNSLAHNNGIASITKTAALPDGPAIAFVKDSMTRGDLLLMPRVLRWVVTNFVSWSEAFLRKAA